MSTAGSDDSRTIARIAGALYLAIIAGGLFSELYVRGTLVVDGDAVATTANLLSQPRLFRIGFASDLLIFLCDVAVAVLLYRLLLPVGRTLSLMAAAFRLTGTAIYGANLLHHLAPLLLLSDSSFASVPAEVLRGQVMLALSMHSHGYDLGLTFFGVHCLLLGILLQRADFTPPVLGLMVGLGGLGYLIGSFTLFLFPAWADLVAPVYLAPLIGELALALWLLSGTRVTSDKAMR